MRAEISTEGSDWELASKFAEIAKNRGSAVLDLDSRKANIQFDHMKLIDQELRKRGTKARLSLVRLLDDPNRLVRFYAAIYLLGLVPNKARAILEWNAKYGCDPLGANARGFLQGLDEGTYKPD